MKQNRENVCETVTAIRLTCGDWARLSSVQLGLGETDWSLTSLICGRGWIKKRFLGLLIKPTNFYFQREAVLRLVWPFSEGRPGGSACLVVIGDFDHNTSTAQLGLELGLSLAKKKKVLILIKVFWPIWNVLQNFLLKEDK